MTTTSETPTETTAPPDGPASDAPLIPEGFELHSNGTATLVLHVDDPAEGAVVAHRWNLRRPKAGEYRSFREQLEELSDDALRRQREVRHTAETAAPDDDEATLLAIKLSREMTSLLDAGRASWLRNAVETLAGRALPPDDDLPAWFGTDADVAALLKHWRTAPSPRGVR